MSKKKITAIVLICIFVLAAIATGVYQITKDEVIPYTKTSYTGAVVHVDVRKHKEEVKAVTFSTSLPYKSVNGLSKKTEEKFIKDNTKKLIETSKQTYGADAVKSAEVKVTDDRKYVEASVTVDLKKLNKTGKTLFNTQSTDVKYTDLNKVLTDAGFKQQKDSK